MENCIDRIKNYLLTCILTIGMIQIASAQFCNATVQNVECNGESTGIISINPLSGTAPFDYEWSHNSVINSNEVQDLDAGTYSVTVTDATGASEICTVEITEPTPITITNVVEVDPMCGLMDGSFEISATPQSGGDPALLMYSINAGASFQSDNTFTDLGPGDYLIIVLDENGCFIVESRQLVDATSVVIATDSEGCEIGGTVGIDISPTGGTTPYDYMWTGPGTFTATTQDIVGGPQGMYTVVVTDREGCSASASYTVEDCCDTSGFCDADIQGIVCAGEDSGSITVNPSSGTAPYTFQWSHDASNFTNEASNLGAGNYDVTVTDAGGCELVCSYTIAAPTPIDITELSTLDPMCGLANGNIMITATPQSGGNPALLMYSIDGGTTFQTSDTFNNLAAGSYLIVVIDENGCFDQESIDLFDAGGVTVMTESAMCEVGGTIAIDITASGGTLPYDYAWTGPGTFAASTEDISGAPQGSYMVVVTDAEGCAFSQNITVEDCCDSSMFCEGTVQDILCSGEETGVITVNPVGGTAPFDYEWSHDGLINSNQVTDLTPGNYEVTITDANDCFTMCGFTITEPTPIVISDVLETDPMCGLQDGSLTIIATPQSGSDPANLQYSIDGGASFSSDNEFTDLGPGDYFIIVADTDGCFVVDSRQLVDAGGVMVNLVNAACVSSGTVNIDIMPVGGTLPYTYSWTGPGGFMASTQDISGGPQGAYDVTVTDREGCSVSASYLQDNCCDPSMFCQSTVEHNTCNGDASGQISISPIGGTGPFTYTWSHDAGLTTSTATGLPGGFYNVTITDATGCNAVCGVDVEEPSAITIDNIETIDPLCGETNGSLEIFATPKSGSGCSDLEYSLDGLVYQDLATFDNLGAGNYTVFVRDCDLCTASSPVTLSNNAGLVISFNGACDNGNANIDLTVTGGTGPYTYSWTGPGGYASTDEDVVGGPEGDYTVVVTDADGCMEQAMITQDMCGFGIISGTVFEDEDGDGQQDPSEIHLDNIPVTLFTSDGVLVAITLTDINGDYSFPDVPQDQYIIHIGIDPFEYEFTFPNVGTDVSDSDITGTNGFGTSDIFTFAGPDVVIDAGVYTCVPVGELVWFDANMNDQWDLIENGINGLMVNAYRKGFDGEYFLYDTETTGHKPGTQSDDGYYKFCLPPGDYYLEFMIPPFGLVPALPGIGSEETDSDVTNAFGEGTTSSFTINSGDVVCNISAGYYPMASLGNNIFFDGNGNGLQDSGEAGMSNVMVELYDADTDVKIDEVASDQFGDYVFDYLGKDDYYLKVIPPSNYLITIPNVGSDEDMDSDVDNSNGPNTTSVYSLNPGDELSNVDIGLIEASTVDISWIDIYGFNDGKQNEVIWTVGLQNNTSHYEVERRSNNIDQFEVIGEVDMVESNSILQYQFTDFDISSAPLFYYRVAEVDLSGKRNYSDMIAIDTRAERRPQVSISPNPFYNQMQIEVELSSDSQTQIEFFDASGKRVELQGFSTGVLPAGINKLDFNWGQIPPGVYTVTILVDSSYTTQKLIKVE